MIDKGLVLNGRFEVLERLGAGGMGEVYLGRDRSRDQEVAIKRMLIEQDNVDKPLLDRRFKEETEILRRLDCPGIPAFVDAFSEDGHSFLVMEFIQGYSLDTLLRVSRMESDGLTPEQVATVALHVSRVLEYMHAQTPPLVHRDIKPSNMIIRESDQRVFLVDFGLAREIRSKSSAKTQIGTWCYAPIEQIRGQVEPRSDFYSLGVTMLELLSGEVPAALAIPPARQLVPDLPEELARIIDLCTRAEVSRRYSEACLLRQDLEQVLPGLSGRVLEPDPTVSEEDKVAELVRRWGQGRAHPQCTPSGSVPEPQVPILPVPMGATPEVKKAVDRARRRLQAGRPEAYRKRLALFALTVILLLLGGWQGAVAYRYRLQNALVGQLFPAGGPGPGWSCSDRRGLFPSRLDPDALELGAEFWNLAPGPVGLLFQRNQPMPTRSLSFNCKWLRGKADLLVFSGPFGVRLASQGSRYQAEIVRVAPLTQLEIPTYKSLGLRGLVAESAEFLLTSSGGQLILSRDGKEQNRLPRPGRVEWLSQQCGLVQWGDKGEGRFLISHLVVR